VIKLVGPILRWAGGASTAQNSEITLINIGKSWVEDRPITCCRGPVHAYELEMFASRDWQMIVRAMIAVESLNECNQ
jgi:hypothetical protein